MFVKSFKELIVWQKSIDLAQEIYSVSAQLPKKEIYGLCSQIQRSSVSISSNIAEGKKRGTKKEFIRFLGIADGSAAELETQLIIISRTYPDIDLYPANGLLTEVQKMLITMIKRLKLPKS